MAESVAAVKSAGGKSVEARKTLDAIIKLTDEFRRKTDTLQRALDHEGGDAVKHAKHFRDAVIPAMTALRDTGDALEAVVPHELWPLATYREMLFIKWGSRLQRVEIRNRRPVDLQSLGSALSVISDL